jgi:hypothetical protein
MLLLFLHNSGSHFPIERLVKITKGNNLKKKKRSAEDKFLCTAFLLNEIHHADSSQELLKCRRIGPARNKVWKITKGKNSKITKYRVPVFVYCTSSY